MKQLASLSVLALACFIACPAAAREMTLHD
jgi:hypothetical protein